MLFWSMLLLINFINGMLSACSFNRYSFLWSPTPCSPVIVPFNSSALLIKKALELKGTITGEHGVGLHKKEYLLKEHGDNIPVMKLIKRSIDQNNIMNPGKIFDLN